jgi:hypothetical protein
MKGKRPLIVRIEREDITESVEERGMSKNLRMADRENNMNTASHGAATHAEPISSGDSQTNVHQISELGRHTGYGMVAERSVINPHEDRLWDTHS